MSAPPHGRWGLQGHLPTSATHAERQRRTMQRALERFCSDPRVVPVGDPVWGVDAESGCPQVSQAFDTAPGTVL